MLSTKLIRLVEENWEQISARVMQRIRQDPRLWHIREIPESDLRERAQDIISHLDHWLAVTSETELHAHFVRLGEQRFEEGIPLHELVRTYLLIKEAMIDFTRGQGLHRTSFEIYAEEELEHSVGQFFDNMICHVVLGYEAAMERARGPVSARHATAR